MTDVLADRTQRIRTGPRNQKLRDIADVSRIIPAVDFGPLRTALQRRRIGGESCMAHCVHVSFYANSGTFAGMTSFMS